MTRSTSILIRVTPEEAEAFKAAAKAAGLGVGPWLRMLGMGVVGATRAREALGPEPAKPPPRRRPSS
jgi:hypothetical protein